MSYRLVVTLTVLGLILVAIQVVWAPSSGRVDPAVAMLPVLIGMGCLGLAGLVGIAAGPADLRAAVLLGALALLLIGFGGALIYGGQEVLPIADVVLALAVAMLWRAGSRRPANV